MLGMIVPSHFIPLAAPGMVALGLRWMWNPESPFYIQPRLDWDLAVWAWHFWRASTRERVERAAPLLRDLHLASRAVYEQIGDECGLVRKGLLMLCKTQHGLDEEARGAALAQCARRSRGSARRQETAALRLARDDGHRGQRLFSARLPSSTGTLRRGAGAADRRAP